MRIDRNLQRHLRQKVSFSYQDVFFGQNVLISVSSEHGLLFNNDFDAYKTNGYIKNHNNHSIFYEIWLIDSSKPLIVFHHGTAENSSLHSKLIYFYLMNGYNCIVFDQEGCGESDGIRGGLKNDNDFVRNCDCIIEQGITLFHDKFTVYPEIFLTAFSSGAIIILEWYSRYAKMAQKLRVKKIFLFAPYLKIHKRIIKPLTEFFIPLYHFRKSSLLRENFQKAIINGDLKTYIHMNRNISDNTLFLTRQFPDTRIHRINSYALLSSMIKQQNRIIQNAYRKFTIPVFSYAASNDSVVDNEQTHFFMKKIKQFENFFIVENSFHELLDYEDERSDSFYSSVLHNLKN